MATIVTAKALDTATQAGADAYRTGGLRAPGVDATVMDLVGDAPVGTGAADLFAAFLAGFDRAADDAIRRADR